MMLLLALGIDSAEYALQNSCQKYTYACSSTDSAESSAARISGGTEGVRLSVKAMSAATRVTRSLSVARRSSSLRYTFSLMNAPTKYTSHAHCPSARSDSGVPGTGGCA